MSARVNRRKLKAGDVTFTVSYEQDDMPVRGNAMASGNDAADRELEDQIIGLLDSGHDWAWCCIKVVASWTAPDGTEYEGTDYLGACSFLGPAEIDGETWSVQRQIDDTVDGHGMKDQALDDLQRTVNAADRRQAEALVIEAIGAVPKTALQRWAKGKDDWAAEIAKAALKLRAIG